MKCIIFPFLIDNATMKYTQNIHILMYIVYFTVYFAANCEFALFTLTKPQHALTESSLFLWCHGLDTYSMFKEHLYIKLWNGPTVWLVSHSSLYTRQLQRFSVHNLHNDSHPLHNKFKLLQVLLLPFTGFTV